MDNDQLKRLAGSLSKLQESSDKDKIISQDEFMASCLYYVSQFQKIDAERYVRLKEIFDFKTPVVIACKNSTFWQSLDKPTVTENGFDFVSVRKRNSNRKTSSNPDQSSICGSPLKLDVIADLSVFEEADVENASIKVKTVDFGLLLQQVRKLISLYSLLASSKDSIDSDKKGLPTLLALCDGQNVRNVSAMGLTPLVDKQNNFLGVKISDTVCKPAAAKSVHVKLHPSFSSPDITCKAKYDIHTVSDDKAKPDQQSFIQLELEWKILSSQTFMLLHEPHLQARTVAKIQNYLGNTESPMFFLYQEVEILRSVIEGLDTSEVNWLGTQEQPLLEDVKELVEKLKLGSDLVECKLGETTFVSLDETEIVSLEQIEERKDLDFTDHLWKILQACTSYVELVDTFKYVVAELRRGDFQPFINSHNTTTVGQMVKDSYRGQLRTPLLTGLSPLLYLAEMGVQKLSRDYLHVFLSRHLANMGMLDYFLKGNLELEDKLNRLTKLHHSLETVVMLKKYLDLPLECLAKCCREMLKYYESHAVENSHRFAFSVPTTAISNVFEKFTPTEWSVEGVKMVGRERERLVYHFTTEQPCDWVKLEGPTDSSKDGAEDEEDAFYFLTILTDSVSILS